MPPSRSKTSRSTPSTDSKPIPLTFLRSLLSLSHTPVLRPARLTGYKLKLWSLYPILVSKKGSVVEGMLWAGAKQWTLNDWRNMRERLINGWRCR
jgi:hypothetical protein